MAQHLRLIFMGTSAFAVPSLQKLLAHGYPIVAVVTAPDKPQGRGHKVLPSPVEIVAKKHRLPVLKPINLKEEAFIHMLDSYWADLYVVVAFRKLPKVVWGRPKLGTINLHASLLPQYRGAAPIHWAIIQGEHLTGVTTFFMEETIDTGCILLQEQAKIYQTDTVGTLTERLQHQGAQLLIRSIQALAKGGYQLTTQPAVGEYELKQAPKIYAQDCQINWEQSTETIFNFIRGLSPYPAAWSLLNNIPIKIIEGYPVPVPIATPGTICSDGKSYLYVSTQDGAIAIDMLQPAGKNVMTCQAFLQGHRLNDLICTSLIASPTGSKNFC